MSKLILDTYPREPKECPFSEERKGIFHNEKYFLCHLREGFAYDCGYALKKCVGCDRCEKITSLQEL